MSVSSRLLDTGSSLGLAAATNEAILRMPFFSFSSVIDVGGAGVDGRLIVLLAVDALGGAIFHGRAGGENFAVAIKRNRDAELRGGLGVGRLDVGRGIPGRAAAGVNVDRAGIFHGGVRLIPVDALGTAVLQVRTDGNGVAVAAHGQSPSELVVLPRIERLHMGL